MPRIRFDEMKAEFKRVLIKKGCDEESADLSAQLMTETSCDGVYSHGVNRFPRVIDYIEKGYIDLKARPSKVDGMGAFERWDGHLGLGNVNAKLAMDRAVELAKEFGIGCVALANTNHWLRGGSYGWQAAEAGCVGICWTNTQPNMPAWGARDRRIGNNPFVMAVPCKEGHVVVDIAMAQFADKQAKLLAAGDSGMVGLNIVLAIADIAGLTPGHGDEVAKRLGKAMSLAKLRRQSAAEFWKAG